MVGIEAMLVPRTGQERTTKRKGKAGRDRRRHHQWSAPREYTNQPLWIQERELTIRSVKTQVKLLFDASMGAHLDCVDSTSSQS